MYVVKAATVLALLLPAAPAWCGTGAAADGPRVMTLSVCESSREESADEDGVPRPNEAAFGNLVFRIRPEKDCINPIADKPVFNIELFNRAATATGAVIEINGGRFGYRHEPQYSWGGALWQAVPQDESFGSVTLAPGESAVIGRVPPEIRRDDFYRLRAWCRPTGGPLLEAVAYIRTCGSFHDLEFVLGAIRHETDEEALKTAAEVLTEYHIVYTPRAVAIPALLDIYERSRSPELAQAALNGLREAARVFSRMSAKDLAEKYGDRAALGRTMREDSRRAHDFLSRSAGLPISPVEEGEDGDITEEELANLGVPGWDFQPKAPGHILEFARVHWAKEFLEHCPELQESYERMTRNPNYTDPYILADIVAGSVQVYRSPFERDPLGYGAEPVGELPLEGRRALLKYLETSVKGMGGWVCSKSPYFLEVRDAAGDVHFLGIDISDEEEGITELVPVSGPGRNPAASLSPADPYALRHGDPEAAKLLLQHVRALDDDASAKSNPTE